MQPWFGAPRLSQKAKIQLGRIQRMVCLAITEAKKSTPSAAMEVLLNLTPLYLLNMADMSMALYRLQIFKQLNIPRRVSGLLTIWKYVGDPLLHMWLDFMIPVYYYTKNFMVKKEPGNMWVTLYLLHGWTTLHQFITILKTSWLKNHVS
jgi:hypothetical protein